MFTKQELINGIVVDHRILKEDAAKITEIVFAQIRKRLLEGKEVRVDGVGSFRFHFKDPGVVNNNLLGKRHKVGSRVHLKFKVFPSMQRSLNLYLAGD